MKKWLKKHIYLITGISGMIFAALLFAGQPRAAVGADSILKDKCYQCHGPERISQYQLSAEKWKVIVDRMSLKKNAMISRQEADEIGECLKSEFLLDAKALFDKRCFDCHAYINKKDLLLGKKTREGWARAIERMRKKYSFLIGKKEAEILSDFWGDPENNPNVIPEDEETRKLAVVENKCLRCHTHGFIFNIKKTDSQWNILLERKQKKYKHWITNEDEESVRSYLRQ